MPFNGSGVFNRVYSWQADKAAGIDITASRMDLDTNDIAANGLSVCLTRDGQGGPTANLPMGGFRHTGAANAVGSGDYVTLGQLQGGVTTLTVSGVSTLATVNVTGPITLDNLALVKLKDTGGTSHSFFGMTGSNNVDMFVSGGQSIRVLSQNGATVLFTIDNAGNISTAHGSINPIGSNTPGWTISPTGTAAAYTPTGSNVNFGIPGDGTFIGFFNGTSTNVGSIQVSGGVTSYNTTSDETLKDLVAPLNDSGSIIDGLKALWYRWKDRPLATPEPGFFAQSVHRVFPWAVTPGNSEKPWQMDASRLMPVVVAELQALRRRVAELEAR